MFHIFSLIIVVLLSLPAAAQQPQHAIAPQASHAIAMHGTPKYPADFTQLDYANPNALKGGTLRLSQLGSFDSLNPFTVRGNRAQGFAFVLESLMMRAWNEPFTLYGLIAQSITTPEDRSWVEFKLNPKACWNDGTSLTAQDVLFSYQTLREKGRPNHRTFYKKVTKAEIIGTDRVKFTFDMSEGGDREMPLIMGLMPIIQKKWWEGRDLTAPTLDIFPTSGPYKIERIEPGRKVVYARDKNYWGNDLPINNGQWNFDTIVQDYYRDDDVALEAFKAGNVDLRRESDPTKWRTGYPANPAYTLLDIPNARPEPLRGLIFNTRREMFADIKVRQALSAAFDFEWVNRALYGGLYKRAVSTFPNSELAFSGLPEGLELEALKPWASELPPALFTQAYTLPGSGSARERLKQADSWLREAGWLLKDGVRMKDGKAFVFQILLSDPNDEKIALEFARGLKRLGIRAEVRTVDSAQYQSRATDYDFDMTINFWSSTLSPGNEQVFYWGSKSADAPGTRNYAGIKSAAVDALASSIAAAPSREALVARARALDRILMWHNAVIPLYYLGRDLIAANSQLGQPITPIYGVMPEQTWWWKDKTQ
jgi:microcin C transport system substrate-binding protein